MRIILIFLISFLFFSCKNHSQKSSIIPQVKSFLPYNSFFHLKDFQLFADSISNGPAELLMLELNKLSYSIDTIYFFKDPMQDQAIHLIVDSTLSNNLEYYELHINKNFVLIKGASVKGVIHAVYSFLQLLPRSQGILDDKLSCVSIKDVPKFQWRGLLLDCSRHFMQIEFVKRYIDLLAFHKMNVLHWHLTEDQGWRIQIKKYPKLTEIGAYRIEKDGSTYGGFYTQQQIKELVLYANQRGVTVVPEIELPGHCLAALAAYPQYSCTGGPFEVETDWGVFKEIYCAGNEQTFNFIHNILDEVIELFPGEYIHIGGDEVPKYRWKRCDKCKKRMMEESIKDVDELQSYFIQRIESYLIKKGKKIIGWDEILEGQIPSNATVQSWRGMDGAIKAAKSGHDVVVSPTSHAYFDYDLDAIDLRKVYSFDPIPDALTKTEQMHILGGECNMWSEYAPQNTVDSKVFPRLLAMSEVLWTAPEQKNYDSFYKRVQNHYSRLTQLKVDFGLETIPLRLESTYSSDSFHINLIAENPNFSIFYQLDNKDTLIFDSIFSISGISHLSAWATINKQVHGKPIEDNLYTHKALNANIITLNSYSEDYSAGGDYGIIDGIRGGNNFRDGRWQGYFGKDFEVILDLKKVINIQRLVSSFYQYNLSWIFMPKELIIHTSIDGKNFNNKAQLFPLVPMTKNGKFNKVFELNFPITKARYVKFKAKNIGVCPDWHPAAGSNSWLFVDEIQLY